MDYFPSMILEISMLTKEVMNVQSSLACVEALLPCYVSHLIIMSRPINPPPPIVCTTGGKMTRQTLMCPYMIVE